MPDPGPSRNSVLLFRFISSPFYGKGLALLQSLAKRLQSLESARRLSDSQAGGGAGLNLASPAPDSGQDSRWLHSADMETDVQGVNVLGARQSSSGSCSEAPGGIASEGLLKFH